MALIGNCKHIHYTQHDTDTETETITHPDGTIENVEVPVMIKHEVEYENVYLCIKQIENQNINQEGNYVKNIFYQYAAYENKSTRDNDQEDFLFWKSDIMPKSLNHSKTLYKQVYDVIKQTEGLTDLIEG